MFSLIMSEDIQCILNKALRTLPPRVLHNQKIYREIASLPTLCNVLENMCEEVRKRSIIMCEQRRKRRNLMLFCLFCVDFIYPSFL